MCLVLPPCNFGEILTQLAQRTSRMLNMSIQNESLSKCDMQGIDHFETNVSPQKSKLMVHAPRSLQESNAKKYIATLDKINKMLEELIKCPQSSCSFKNNDIHREMQSIIIEVKRAISNPITSQTSITSLFLSLPSKLESQLVSTSGIRYKHSLKCYIEHEIVF